MPLESIVSIEGFIEDEKICVTSYDVIAKPVSTRSVNYLEFSDVEIKDFVRDYIWFYRNGRLRNILVLQHVILSLIRRFLEKQGFIELPPPIIAPSSDPGLRGASKVSVKLYGRDYELSSSLIMYKQLSVGLFKKIFYVARNIREEPLEHMHTGRHLVEFTQVDLEVAFTNIDELIKLAEELIYYVLRELSDRYQELVDSIGFRKQIPVHKPPYARLTYDEVLDFATKRGYSVKWGSEIPFEVERILGEDGAPVWITCFPRIARGFYYLEKPDDERYNLDFNLIMPEGFGEIIDGGLREFNYDRLVEKIKVNHRESIEKYEWFLKFVKEGAIPPSGGFGLGLERFVAYVAGVKHIALVSYPPRLPGYIG